MGFPHHRQCAHHDAKFAHFHGVVYAAIPVGSLFLLLDYMLIAIYGKHPFSGVSKAEEIPPPPAAPQPLAKEAGEDA